MNNLKTKYLEVKKATPKSDSCVELPGWITALFNEFARTGATDIFLISLSIATAPFIILNDLLDLSTIPVNVLAVLNAPATAVAPTVAEVKSLSAEPTTFNLLSLRLFILNFYWFPSSSAYLFNSKSCRALVGLDPMRCTFF